MTLLAGVGLAVFIFLVHTVGTLMDSGGTYKPKSDEDEIDDLLT